VVTGELKEQNDLQGGYGTGRSQTGTSLPPILLLLCHFTLPINTEGPHVLLTCQWFLVLSYISYTMYNFLHMV